MQVALDLGERVRVGSSWKVLRDMSSVFVEPDDEASLETSNENSTQGGHEIRLPPELLEAIVDQIPFEERPTLQSCALVCRLFTPRAQRTLFRSITLGRPHKGFRWDVLSLRHPSRRFFGHMNAYPHLQRYVEELEITDNAHLTFYREELSWLRSDPVLSLILAQLQGLRQLRIAGNYIGNRLNFRAWTEALKRAVLGRCQSELMTRISLECMRNVPVAMLMQAPALEVLEVRKCVFVRDEVPAEGSRVFRPRLREFWYSARSLYEWASFYPWLMDEERGVDWTGVELLSLDVSFGLREDIKEKDMDSIAWIIRQCAATVGILSLFYPVQVRSYGHTLLDLSTFPNLHALTLQGHIWSPGGTGPEDTLPWLISTLNRIPIPTSLSTLHLLCILEDSPFAWNSMLTVSTADWAGFVRALGRLVDARVEVFLRVSIQELVHGRRVLNVVEAGMKEAAERGVVVQIQTSLDSDVELESDPDGLD
ncbi:hypothetical protein BDN70DRAFT_889612 [Pholiota conissans]|uniref:F-box domain-containing protein n=1 Tax=Pholiota conissans TaxID=109636 RepID=A0A9P5ZI18_9AGAR|nr:hypothetical protein BDN70DRAFT_889612 [Pholiota conissans]